MSRHRDPRSQLWVDDGSISLADDIDVLFDRLEQEEAIRASERTDMSSALSETGTLFSAIDLNLARRLM